ncbi:hypothetical protein DCS_03455 [Drechmeria coniospora]|uniref:Uncharacterized protein n=1 Tax=Drechmeria coniospora TaxID=98403 RepID=A0A151GH73_DRECN|nr:hypothetical protein DCS_03455 [Drechmeria coniospora]KYK56455.1 hypothetical protein DCS_03455 [Drechmeria coniospora]
MVERYRSDAHSSTSIAGIHHKDPKGLHVTLCYKDEGQATRGTHVASHGYVVDAQSLEFREATHAREKADGTMKSSGGLVWPPENELYAAPEIGYGHFPQDDESDH